MDKIDILIKDNKEFGDVAFLVDTPAFLKAVERLRKKWGIKQLIPPDKFNEWKYGLVDMREGKLKEQETLRELPNDHLSDADLEFWNEKIKRVMPDIDFECDVRDLRIEFNKPETFDVVIAHAMVCGIIPDGVYKSTYYETEIPVIPQRLQDRTTRVSIFITPQSQKGDVLRVFKEVKDRVFKPREDGYNPFFSLYNKDEVTSIKRDRDWYWKHLKGASYKAIALEDNKNRLTDRYWVEDYAEVIRKAVKRYQKVITAT